MANSENQLSVYADVLYDGVSMEGKSQTLVCVSEGRIASVFEGVPASEVPSDALHIPIVMPGFIDLQINGAGDVQFNFDLSLSGLATMVAASARGGATHIFPTFTTAPGSDYRQALDIATEAVAKRMPGVAGLHLEGPFISPKRPGIHRPEFIRPLSQADVDVLREAASALKVVLTIAPEEQEPELLEQLSNSGIILFAGHSEATFEDMRRARQVGVAGVTHLFNAMSQITPREPGVVGTVLGGGDFYAGIIADGYHVHPQNLDLAVKTLPDNLCLVSDAMQTMNGMSQEMMLYGTRITLAQGRLTGEDGTIGGAHLSMAEAVANVSNLTGAALGAAARFASANPARAVGLQDTLGHVTPGFNASMTFLSGELECVGVMREGEYFTPI